MIRNVVLGRLRDPDDADARQVLAEGLAGIAGLDLPGLLACAVGRDAGLRPGGWDFAITNDWRDAAAYRAYDVDETHNRFRLMIVSVCREVARVQYEVPDA